MNKQVTSGKMIWAILCGVFGSVLMGLSDWLMIYGDTAYRGSLAWLTVGVAQIPAWRNGLAMMLAFPAVVLYAVALFYIRYLLTEEKHRKVYTALTASGMTPWLCLHLFYSMILFLFGWMNGNGLEKAALPAAEALFEQFAWVVPAGEVLMVLPFCYLFYTVATGRSLFSRWMAFNNPLIIFVVMKLLTALVPDGPARLAFTNGLMSESMLVCFLILLAALFCRSQES